MTRRILAAALAAACVSALAAPAGAAPAADELIARMRDDTLPEKELDAIARELAAAGDADAIFRAALSREFDAFRTAKLARALGLMGTAEALAALRKMLFTSVFVSGDVRDWRGLAARISRGEAESALAIDRAVWARLSEYVRALVKQTAATGEIEPVRARDVVRELNAVLKDRRLYRHFGPSGVRLEGEAAELLERHKAHPEPKPGTALSRIEVERMNRSALDRVYAGLTAPLDGVPITKFHPFVVRGAHEALGLVEADAALELLFNTEPIGFKDRLRQVELARAVPGPDAEAALGLYLTDDETAISARARDGLVARFAERPVGARLLMTRVMARVRLAAGEDLKDTALADVFAVCAAVPDDGEAARLFAEALAVESDRVRLAALEALAGRPALAADTSLLDALYRVVEDTRSADVRKKVLRVIGDARAEGGADIAAMCLDDPDLEVQTLAVRVLRRTTDLGLGLGVQAWRDHFAGKREAAAGGAEAGARPAGPGSGYRVLRLLVGLTIAAALVLAAAALRRRWLLARIGSASRGGRPV